MGKPWPNASPKAGRYLIQNIAIPTTLMGKIMINAQQFDLLQQFVTIPDPSHSETDKAFAKLYKVL